MDFSAFNLQDKRPELVQRIKALQPEVSNRAIAAAIGVDEGTVRRDIRPAVDRTPTSEINDTLPPLPHLERGTRAALKVKGLAGPDVLYPGVTDGATRSGACSALQLPLSACALIWHAGCFPPSGIWTALHRSAVFSRLPRPLVTGVRSRRR
jgi:hypothetical protein